MVSYETTFQDFKNAQRLYLRHRKWAGYRLLAAQYGFAVGALILFSTLIVASVHHDQPLLRNLVAPFVWFLFMAIFLPVMRWFNIRKTFRRCKPDESGDTIATTFSHDENGFYSALPGRSEGRFFWNALQDYAEDERLALLFVKKKVFLYIPKRAMSEAQWAELRIRVGAQLGHV